MNCQVCDKPIRKKWDKPGTLAGCHRYIAIGHDGKLGTFYFGPVHKKCDRVDWPRRIRDAIRRGWLVPNPEGKGYIPAPQYR